MSRVVATFRLNRNSVAMRTNGREGAEFERLLDEERREEDADGQRHREREQEVQQHCGERQHHHEDDADDPERHDEVAATGASSIGERVVWHTAVH